MIGSESDEENELLIENFDNETFEQLIGSSACLDATTRGNFSVVFRIFCLEDRFDVIERAPGVKIFHRGWQVGQTTQK